MVLFEEKRQEPAVAEVARCPYPGLAAFTTDDADLFFGRERATADLVARLGEQLGGGCPVVLVGPAGAGKTSLLRAGLIPALRGDALPGSDRWRVVVGTPSADPTAAVDGRATTVLVVDRFEEASGLDGGLVENLCALAAGPVPVVLAVRADSYARLLADARLARSAHEAQVALGPMSADEVRAAIIGPAAAVGVRLEPGLVDLLLDDLATTGADGLPLLAYTLRETWRHREDGTLTIAGYRRTGGLPTAVATAAERAHADLDPAARDAARRALLDLVRGSARRPARVLDGFTRAGLTGTRTSTGETVHEVLPRVWPRLREWLEADRAGEHIHRRLTAAAREWESAGRDPALLYRGTRLAVTRDWAADHDGLGPLETAYLTAGIAMEENEQRAGRRRVRRWRGLATALAVCLVVAVAGGAVAWRRTTVARSDQFATMSVTTGADRPEAALAAAVAAHDLADTPHSRGALLSTQALPYLGPVADHGTTGIGAVAVAPGGDLLATADPDGAVRLWDLDSRRRVSALPQAAGEVRALAFSPDGTLLATAGDHGTTVLAIGSRSVLRTLPDTTNDVAFSPDGTRLARAMADGTVRRGPVATGFETTVGVPGPELTGVAFQSDGGLVTTAPAGATTVWDAAGRAVRRTGGGNDVAVGPDGTLVAVADDDGARLWDARTGGQVAELQEHGEPVGAVAFSQDGTLVATAGRDDTARVWDTASRHEVRVLTGHRGPVDTLAFTPDGRALVTGAEDGLALLWSLRGAATGIARPVSPLHGLARHGDRLATAAEDGSLSVWDTADLAEPSRRLPGAHPGGALAVAFDPAGTRLAAGGTDAVVSLWDTDGYRRTGTLRGHAEPVTALAFDPDGSRLVSGAEDHTVRVWDLDRRTAVCVLSGHTAPVAGVAVSHDGTTIATAGLDHHVRLWDIRTCRPTRVLPRQPDTVLAVAFGPDDATLATGGGDNAVRLHSLGDADQPPVTLTGHTGPVADLRFDDDGTLVSASHDGTARFWDVEAREPRIVLRGHTAPVRAAVHDGGALWTVSLDGTVRAWDLDSAAATARACAALAPISPQRWRRLAVEPSREDVCPD